MEPGLSSRTAFRPAPAAVQLACSFILLNSAPLVNARDPFEIRFYSPEIIPLSIGVPSRKAISPPLFYPSLWDASLSCVLSDLPGGCLSSLPWSPPMGPIPPTACAPSIPSPMSEMDREEASTSALSSACWPSVVEGMVPSSWPRILWARSWQKAFRVETPVSNSS